MFTKKFIRSVLYQAFGFFPGKPTDIYLESNEAAQLSLQEYQELENYLLDNNYIIESGELNYFKMTPKGENLVYDSQDV